MRLPKLAFRWLFALSAWPTAVIAVDGYFDPIWAGGGRITFAADFHNPDRDATARQVIRESDGRLLLGGTVSPFGQSPYWWLGELHPDGTPVLTFGESNGSGLVTACFLSPSLCAGDVSFALAGLQGDGKIQVVAGTTLSRTSSSAHALDAAGVSGGTGNVGLRLTLNNVQGGMSAGYTIAGTANGRWIVGGAGRYSAAATQDDAAVVRLNPDFSLDPTFNAVTDINGVVFRGGLTLNLGAPSQAVGSIVQKDGRIVLAARVLTSIESAAVLRLNADGSRDASFGTAGVTTIQRCRLWPGTRILADRAGRLLIACQRRSSAPGMRFARLGADGALDPSFGSSGIAMADPGSALCDPSVASAVAIDSAGRLLVAGICDVPSSGGGGSFRQQFLVARLFGDNGALDTSFGSSGFSFGRFAASSSVDAATDIIFDVSGRPLVVGESWSGPNREQRAGLARLTYDLIFTDDLERVPRGRLP